MGECSQPTSISTLFHDEGQRNFKYRGWHEITVIIRITTRVGIDDIISLFEERVVGPKEIKSDMRQDSITYAYVMNLSVQEGK